MLQQTTAIYKNRIKDKNKVESLLFLNEFGDDITEFYTNNNILIAIGYNRVCYGDHGSYVEFEPHHIKCNYKSKFNQDIDINNIPPIENCNYYYYWLTIPTTDIKIYFQLKPVDNIPNAPPRDDKIKSNYNRKEGYADYKRGKFYISPFEMKFKGNIKTLF